VTRTSFAIAIAAAALSITPAFAADLGRFPPQARFYPPTPMLRVYNWTGCYLGAQLGSAFADNKSTGQFAGFFFNENDSAAAVVAGGQVGCDLQFAPNWVIGAQIDGAWTNLVGSEALTGSAAVTAPVSGTLALNGNLNFKTNVIATATGRIGYAANFDSIAGLFYLKGGAAFINNDTSTFGALATFTPNSCAPATPPCPSSGAVNFNAPSGNRWGWTIGVGTEWVVDGNWSIFGEWDYMNFGTQTLTFTDATLGSSQVSLKQQINELKLGINYRFGNPLPGQYP
jgi:outer membrane immunogenic protein